MEMIYVYMLKDKIIDNCGNKTMFLSILKAKGYNIPLGVVIDFEEFKTMVKNQGLDFDTISKLQIPDAIIDQIYNVLPNSKMFAIRSSANVEDRRNISFSGKFNTYLNVNLLSSKLLKFILFKLVQLRNIADIFVTLLVSKLSKLILIKLENPLK